VNGDGLPDIVRSYDTTDASPYCATTQTLGTRAYSKVYLNNGHGWDSTPISWTIPVVFAQNGTDNTENCGVEFADVNGDGLPDLVQSIWSYPTLTAAVYLNNGSGWNTTPETGWTVPVTFVIDFQGGNPSAGGNMLDIDGDGLPDLVIAHSCTPGPGGSAFCANNTSHGTFLNRGPNPDLLASVSNGIGGSTNVSYAKAVSWPNNQIPFPYLTLSSATTNDGNGVSSTTTFSYSNGLYDGSTREFRGFGVAQTQTAAGTTSIVTKTSFKQDSTFKGRVSHQQTQDTSGRLYNEVANTWGYITPFQNTGFPELQKVDTTTYDGNPVTSKQTEVQFQYDCDTVTPCYGNQTKVSNLGQVSPALSGDERYDSIEYTVNPSAYIVSLPSHQYTLASDNATKVSESWFTYDGQTPNHTSPPAPTLGNLTTVEKGLNTVAATTRLFYDSYGNLILTLDPNGNFTFICFDASATFPQMVMNNLNQMTMTQYYGMAWNAYCGTAPPAPTGTGLFGQVGSVTDPNNQTTQTSYDTFGRKIQVTNPDGGIVKTEYLNFGTVGQQKIKTTLPDGTADGLWSETYFDGLGRTFKTAKEGPGGSLPIIYTQTVYDNRGLVSKQSLPSSSYPPTLFTSFTYDPIGRVTNTTNSDGTVAQASYSPFVVTTVDANSHQRQETKDAYGRLIKVDEYTTSTSTPYATTTYTYDVLGNLLSVTDAKQNQTKMVYDSLSRKTDMFDPDMGHWTYQYDPVGNLIQQTDAKGQVTYLVYDRLNRVSQKVYGSGGTTTATITISAKMNSSGTSSTGATVYPQMTLRKNGTNLSTWTVSNTALSNFTVTGVSLNGGDKLEIVLGSQGTSASLYIENLQMGGQTFAADGPGVVLVSGINIYAGSHTLTQDGNYLRFISGGSSTNGGVSYINDNTSLGRLGQVVDQSGQVYFGYDPIGRVIWTLKNLQGDTTWYVTQNAYDQMGRVTRIIYPDNAVINYSYNTAGWLSSVADPTTVTNPITYASYTNYNALGQPGTVSFGNTVATNYTYSNSNSGNSTCLKNNFRLCTIVTKTAVSTYQNLTYGYDNVGNVTSITDPINGDQSFGYDELNRLTSASIQFGVGGLPIPSPMPMIRLEI